MASASSASLSSRILQTQFDGQRDRRKHVPMQRVLASLVVLCLAVLVLAAPSAVEAKPGSKPSPRPTPTAKPKPSPSPTPTPYGCVGIDISYHQGTIDWQ